jgi:hypothetical protein
MATSEGFWELAETKMYTVVTVDFPAGPKHIPVEMPEGLNKEESRVFALGASEGVLALIRMALGDENIVVTTTGWDESNLPENGTIRSSTE